MFIPLTEALKLAYLGWSKVGRVNLERRVHNHSETVRSDQFGRPVVFGTQDPNGRSKWALKVRKHELNQRDIVWAWQGVGQARVYLGVCVQGVVELFTRKEVKVKMLPSASPSDAMCPKCRGAIDQNDTSEFICRACGAKFLTNSGELCEVI